MTRVIWLSFAALACVSIVVPAAQARVLRYDTGVTAAIDTESSGAYLTYNPLFPVYPYPGSSVVYGELSSASQSCTRGRELRLFHVTSDGTTRVQDGTSDDTGQYAFFLESDWVDAAPEGELYVKARRRATGSGERRRICRAGTSPTVSAE